MSEILEKAARRDPERAAALDQTDRAMGVRFLFAHGVTHTRPILATREHRCAANDEAPDCKACTVTGGDRAPMAHRRCEACRNLALVFQQQRSEART